jgi:hypothetical protein
MFAAFLAILAVVLPPDFSVEPDPPVAGRMLRITPAENMIGRMIHLSDPLGMWSVEFQVESGPMSVEVPGDVRCPSRFPGTYLSS